MREMTAFGAKAQGLSLDHLSVGSMHRGLVMCSDYWLFRGKVLMLGLGLLCDYDNRRSRDFQKSENQHDG